MLPKYFTDLKEPITLPGFDTKPRLRWQDDFATPQGEERRVLSLPEIRAKDSRDAAYARWLSAFRKRGIRGKRPIFQAIRVLSDNHGRKGRSDWWPDFKEAVFRVYMNPHVEYDPKIYDHVSWYILCPEDNYLVQCFRRWRRGVGFPMRSTFTWISPHPELRTLLMIPVECCAHMRHETTAGALPHGL